MSELLEFAIDLPPHIRDYLGYRTASDALCDPRGRLVRFTPWRRTVMHVLPDGSRVFCKFRDGLGGRGGLNGWGAWGGRRPAARVEWSALEQLRGIGLRVPRRLFVASRGATSVVGMVGVPGRPMDVLLAAGSGRQWALDAMPAVLRVLHGAGWVFRDMYWNHVFAAGEAGEAGVACGGLTLIDVERAFQPRWRRRRWLVKDLAGLLASDPSASSRTDRLRFLRLYLGGLAGDWRALARDVAAKAAAIRGHATRYPG